MALTQTGTDGIKNDAITLAKQAAGTDGQIITYDASGNPVAVGPGTDGQVLTSTGAGSPPAFEAIPTQISLANDSNNRVITGTGSGLNGETNLTFDGSKLLVTGQAEVSSDLDIASDIRHIGDTNTKIRFPAADTITAETDGNERVRVDSDGHVQIGTTGVVTGYSSSGRKLTVYKGDGNGGVLELGSSTNADAYNAGSILFNNAANSNGTQWQADSKLVGIIRAEIITTDSNAGDDSGADLTFYTKPEAAAGGLAMTIHGERYVTTPGQPCSMYKALSNSHTGSATDSTEVLLFKDVKRNEGSHYNTTNGRFTAPVAGTYFVGHNCLIDNDAGDVARSADLQVNGSGYVTLWYYESGGDNDYHGVSGTAIVELSANDFIQIRATAGIHTGSETSFSVYLLG